MSSQHSPGRAENKHLLPKEFWSPDRYLSPGLPEYITYTTFECILYFIGRFINNCNLIFVPFYHFTSLPRTSLLGFRLLRYSLNLPLSGYAQSNGWIAASWVSEGRRSGLCMFCGTVHAFALKDFGISWKSTGRRTVLQVETRTWDQPDM